MDAYGLINVLAQGEEQARPSLDSLPMMLMGAGVLLLIVVLMGHLRKTVRKNQQAPNLEPKERIQSIREEAHSSTSILEKRTAQAEEIVRELTGQLEGQAKVRVDEARKAWRNRRAKVSRRRHRLARTRAFLAEVATAEMESAFGQALASHLGGEEDALYAQA